MLHFLKAYGLRDTTQRILADVGLALFKPFIRKRAFSPTLLEFHFNATSVHTSVEEVAQACLTPTPDEETLRTIGEEYEALDRQLAERYRERELGLPEYYRIGGQSGRLIYTLVRLVQPENVLETGVANGHSSFLILHAMMKNGRGTLHSVDVDRKVGVLLDEREKACWRLNILDATKQGYTNYIATLPPLDLYVHDSNHTYWWMHFELKATLPRMAAGGLIACDDADHSYGFLDFCREIGVKPTLLLDLRNVFGVLHVPQTQAK